MGFDLTADRRLFVKAWRRGEVPGSARAVAARFLAGLNPPCLGYHTVR
jgi:hypothetical protein